MRLFICLSVIALFEYIEQYFQHIGVENFSTQIPDYLVLISFAVLLVQDFKEIINKD